MIKFAVHLLLALLLLGPLAAGQSAPDDQAFEDVFTDFADDRDLQLDWPETDAVHSEFITDEDLQLEWPVAEPVEEQRDPTWLRALAQFLGNLFASLGPVFRILFWAIVAGGVLSILYFMFQGFLHQQFDRFRRDKGPKIEISEMPDFRPDAHVARSLLDDADALAAQGRYAEAVHLLLFRSIEDIQQRREGGVPVSFTAREITHMQAMPEQAKSRLSPIVGIVERSFFGGRPVDETGWRDARRSYEKFAFGDAWA